MPGEAGSVAMDDPSRDHRRLYDLLASDPTLRAVSTADLQAAIVMYDEKFDNRVSIHLTPEQVSAVRHILSILNGELAERTERGRSQEIPAIHVPSAVAAASDEERGWIKRLFR